LGEVLEVLAVMETSFWKDPAMSDAIPGTIVVSDDDGLMCEK
jgi:hypothetical protein